MPDFRVIEPDLGLINEVKKAGGGDLKKCFQCATCSVVCNLSPDEKPFPRKEMIMTQWGQSDQLMKDPDVWLCYQCNDCSTHCPRGARPGDVLAAVRSYIYKRFAVPSFMGKALASPKALPILFLVPILIILGCIVFTAPLDSSGEYLFLNSPTIDFDYFVPHQTVDALFVFGLAFVYFLAMFGFLKFWKALKSGGHESKISFISAFIKTIIGIILHSDFFSCDTNKPRSWGHILVFAGFIFSFIATGIVFILIFVPHYLTEWNIYSIHILPWPPVEFPSIIKIFGALGGIAILVGVLMLMIRRWTNKDEVGANGYTDNLFIYIVFFTGLTGMLSWLIRIADFAMLAYASYFLHLVFVFFLLWYMPYSKFAHMVYRTLALVYARSIGRSAKS